MALGHVIQDQGFPYTQRTNLNFVGDSVSITDDSVNDATKVHINPGLTDLDGVTISAPETDHALVYNGTNWANTALPSGVTAHGALSGLTGSDDHTQYMLRTDLSSVATDKGADLVKLENTTDFGEVSVQTAFEAIDADTAWIGGAFKVGFDADVLVSGWPSIHNVGTALSELTYGAAGKGASIISIETGSIPNSTNVQEALEELASGGTNYTLAPEGYTSLEFTSITGASTALPTNSGAVRLGALSDCLVKFGDASVVVEAAASLYMPKGSEIFGIPAGATHIAVKGVGASGFLSVTGLDSSYQHVLDGFNVVLPVRAGPSIVLLPSNSTKIRLFSMTDCRIEFEGVADDNSMLFQAGTEILSVPSGATYISAKRYSLDGGLYISGVS